MSVVDFLVSAIAPTVLIDTLRKQNPRELGLELAEPVDKFLDAQFGEKKSEMLQRELKPFLVSLMKGFLDGLEKDI